MYWFERYRQLGLVDFNQPAGVKMDCESHWVKKAAAIPWGAIEEKYGNCFPVIQECLQIRSAWHWALWWSSKQYGYSDRELLEKIRENPYYHYFIGLPGFQSHQPFVPSLLVEFCKQLNGGVVIEINEMIIAYNTLEDSGPRNGSLEDSGAEEAERSCWTQSARCRTLDDYRNLLRPPLL